jgi:predicted PurR-regulated permease PerM
MTSGAWRGRTWAGWCSEGASTAAHVLIMGGLTIVITFFLLKDGDRMASWIGDRLTTGRRDRLRSAAGATWTRVASFARGQALIGVIEAVLTAIALIIIGVPAVLPLALLTLVGSFIPLVGPIVAGGAAALVALSAAGLAEALWVVAAAVAINQIESNLLQPFVLGRAVRLHPLVVLLAMTIGGVVGGLAGAFVAVPLTAAALTAVEHLGTTKEGSAEPLPSPGRA